MQVLLSGGAQISKEDRSEALRSAIHFGNLKIVKVLLADGAKISVENKGKIVAEAVAKGHFQIVQALLSDEAQDSKEDRGEAPKNAADIGHLNVAQNSAESKYPERLPYEMKVKIAEHLTDIKDLENLAKVSADWKEAALEVMACMYMQRLCFLIE